MLGKDGLEERCYRILEEKGGSIADKARTALLEEESLRGLEQPLRHISEHWRDLLTPSLVVLSCESVGGKANNTTDQAGLALMLMNLSFYLWDDIVDKTMYRRFLPTVVGKFGEGVALITGGLTTAKAFSILNRMRVDESKRETVSRLVWNYWRNLAKGETMNIRLRGRNGVKPEEKLEVFEMEGVNLETSSKIGGVLGNGSEEEIEHLGKYGRYLGTILELRKDFDVSINFTFELAQKIRSGALPYAILWARDHSRKVQECLSLLGSTVEPADIRKIVEATLEAEALENTIELVNALTGKAEMHLRNLTDNEATRRLKVLVAAQAGILTETLASF